MDNTECGVETILILEDDPAIAHLERARLDRAGYDVRVASTAVEARELIERGGIALLVLDYRLEGETSGLDFHNELQAAGLRVPSILVTGFGDEAMLARALRAGVRDFLPKTPDYLDFLAPTVRRVMAQVRTERQLEQERAQRVREQAARAEAEAQRAALAESEARFRILTQAIPQLVWSCRTDGDSDFSNDQWCEYTGQSPEQSVGHGWMKVIHPADIPVLNRAWREAAATGQVFQATCRIRRAADGQYRWHLSRAWPQRDAAGEIVRWFGTCTDIDDQKRAEQELQNADRRKDEFIAMLAHELRNPLAAINNAIILARKGRGEDDRQWALDMMKRQAATLTRLIDDLLDVSRLRTGKFRVEKKPIDATKVVLGAIEVARPLIQAKAHTLDLAVAPGAGPVIADPTRLEQVVVNLLTNAAKYTDPGGRISVQAGRERDDYVVRVRDSGVGIAAEMLPRVFDLFTQAEGSIDRAHGGLGIGLTLVHRLVTMHGGSVSAASEGPGRGSEFTVRIPMAPIHDAAPPPDEVDPEPPPSASGPCRVLVVDDSKDTSHALARLLQGAGCEVATACDGRSALETARAAPPDLVLLDIRLPDTDGFTLAEQLRSMPGLDQTVLVALSGFAQEHDRQRARDAGFGHFLVKPVNLNTLLTIASEAACVKTDARAC
jgi:PAS domain S-box-containing protein